MIEDNYVPASVRFAKDKFVVLSGCSGGGKSSLVGALAGRGFRVFPEPGRQVIREQLFIGGDATPDGDTVKFLELTISRTIHHMISSTFTDSLIFFDRSIIDQIGGFEQMGMEIPPYLQKAAELFRYRRQVFIMPPWREIFCNDAERTHTFESALTSYAALLKTYERLGYELVTVPRLDVEARADFVLRSLEAG